MQMIFNSLSVYSFTEQTRKPIEHGATLSASCFFICRRGDAFRCQQGQTRPAGVGSGADLYVATSGRSVISGLVIVEELAVGVRGPPDPGGGIYQAEGCRKCAPTNSALCFVWFCGTNLTSLLFCGTNKAYKSYFMIK